jgi:hypothetical protein
VKHLFGRRVQAYVEALTAKTKPSLILVCMIYYPDEVNAPGSWASPALAALGYNDDPAKLQSLIRKGYQEATTRIRIRGTRMVPVPLFHVLDGKTTSDYDERVEPSPSGGRKMAEYLLDVIEENYSSVRGPSPSPVAGHEALASALSPRGPTNDFIRDRS